MLLGFKSRWATPAEWRYWSKCWTVDVTWCQQFLQYTVVRDRNDKLWYQHILWIPLYLLWTILSWSYCIREPVLQTSENLTHECLSGGARIGVRFTGTHLIVSNPSPTPNPSSVSIVGLGWLTFETAKSWVKQAWQWDSESFILEYMTSTMWKRSWHCNCGSCGPSQHVTAQLPALWRSKCKYGLEVQSVLQCNLHLGCTMICLIWK